MVASEFRQARRKNCPVVKAKCDAYVRSLEAQHPEGEHALAAELERPACMDNAKNANPKGDATLKRKRERHSRAGNVSRSKFPVTEKQKALQKCDQAGAPIDASQLAQALSSALGVLTFHGADGKIFRLLQFGGPLAGLLFELPP